MYDVKLKAVLILILFLDENSFTWCKYKNAFYLYQFQIYENWTEFSIKSFVSMVTSTSS